MFPLICAILKFAVPIRIYKVNTFRKQLERNFGHDICHIDFMSATPAVKSPVVFLMGAC